MCLTGVWSKPEKLLYSTLSLQTDSSFTVLNCHKQDRLGVRRFRLGRLGCRVILPGENNITAYKKKNIWRQLCRTSAVKSLKPGWLNTVLCLFYTHGNSFTLVFHESYFDLEIRDCKIKGL